MFSTIFRRLTLVTASCALLAACATTPDPEPAYLTLEPLASDDPIVTRFTPRLTEISPDGRWQITRLEGGHALLGEERSNVVISDLEQGIHYNAPRFANEPVHFSWAEDNGVLISAASFRVAVDLGELDATRNQVAVLNAQARRDLYLPVSTFATPAW